MRYRIRVTRAQVTERTVRATDEDAAVAKVQEELERPYGFLGRWETRASEVEVVAAEPATSSAPTIPGEGPLLLSVYDAAAHLGLSRNSMYELINAGEIEHVRLGRRRFVAATRSADSSRPTRVWATTATSPGEQARARPAPRPRQQAPGQ